MNLPSHMAVHWLYSKERRNPSAGVHGQSMRERTCFSWPRRDMGDPISPLLESVVQAQLL